MNIEHWTKNEHDSRDKKYLHDGYIYQLLINLDPSKINKCPDSIIQNIYYIIIIVRYLV